MKRNKGEEGEGRKGGKKKARKIGRERGGEDKE